jgi:HlyD family secretion protein
VWKWALGVVIVCALLCAGGGYWAFNDPKIRRSIDAYLPTPKPAAVRVEQAKIGQITRTVAAPGQIEPKTSVKISAQVSARILALPFRENEQVRKGDVVVRLDSRDLEALLQAARANLKGEIARLEGSQAGLAKAQADRDRARRLGASGDVPASALEQAESEFLRAQSSLRAAEFSVQAAQAQIIRAEKDLENTTIVSPIDGTITRLDAEVGELVVVGTLNSPGSVIMEIADLSRMVLKARVDESNIVPVKENQSVKVFVNAYGDREFVGFVERVELQRQVDRDNSGYFEAWIPIELAPGEVLRSGLTANCEIAVETLRDVLVVPSQAVIDRKTDELPESVRSKASAPTAETGGRPAAYTRVVFVLEPIPGRLMADERQIYKAIARPVTVGSSDLTSTAVLSGLAAGERVVSGPFKVLSSLRHEQEVALEAGAAAAGPTIIPAEPAVEVD